MPRFALEIEETYQNILRPAILKISDDILDLTSIKDETDIAFAGFAKQVINGQSVMGSDEEDNVNFSHDNRLTIESEVTYPEDKIFDSAPFKGSMAPIVFDEDLSIKVVPVLYQRKVDLSFVLRMTDRPSAMRWIGEIRRRVGQTLKQMYHRIDYSYPIHGKMINTLKHLYDLKENQAGNGETFGEWIVRNAGIELTTLTNRAGDGELLAVKQTQIGIKGQYSFNPVPETVKGDSGDTYTVSFTYSFEFDCPTSLTIEYPLVVHNQLVDQGYRASCDHNVPLVLGTPTKLQWGMGYADNQFRTFRPFEPVVLPCFDDWLPDQIPMKTAGVYTSMIAVDVENPFDVMDLKDLGGEFTLADWLVDMMSLYHDKLPILSESPVVVTLYKNDLWVDDRLLKVSPDLKLTTTEPMDITARYHVRLSLYVDLTLLSESAIRTLLKHGKRCTCLLATLAPELIKQIPKILSNGAMRKIEFWKFIRQLHETNAMYKNGIEIRRLSVGTCVIRNYRR